MFIKKYINRALNKIEKLSKEEVKRLAYRMNEENTILQALLNSLNKALIICDRNHKLLYANKSGGKLLSASCNNTHDEIWQLIMNEQMAFYLEGILKSDSYGDSEDFMINDRLLTLQVEPLALRGRINGSIITVEDVTQQRAQQSLLKRQESLASLANMSAAVAHEIKNPLGALSIHLQLLKRELIRTHQYEPLSDYVSVMDEELERLNEITVNFLYASRPLNLILLKTDIHRLIKQTVKLMEKECQEKDIHLTTDGLKEPILLLLDEGRIKQVLINLIQNARAAIGQHGSILIRLYQDVEWAYLSVADSGEGIPPAIQDKIFEPYFTTKREGTGLGLTLVYKIINDHGGEIKVFSPPRHAQHGTEFVIQLPKERLNMHMLTYDSAASS